MQSGACKSIAGAFLLLLSAVVGGSVLAEAPPAAEAVQGKELLTAAFAGQTEVTISLELNSDYDQPPSAGYLDLENGKKLEPRYVFADMVGLAPGNTIVTLRKSPEQEFQYLVRVDSDGDGNLLEETEQTLDPETPARVRVLRRWPRGPQELQYILSYQVWTDRNGQAAHLFWWKPRYRAEGRFRFQSCEGLFAVADFDGDGDFDLADSARGTSIQSDRNGDGRIWRQDKRLGSDHVIEICGETFWISELSPDASFVKLMQTLVRIPKVGAQVPSFEAQTSAGVTVTSDDLKGETYLMDFWASWCKPCLAGFPKLQELDRKYDGRVKVIAVNVDQETSAANAGKIIKKYDLKWTHIMSGRGDSDPLWRTFGSMEGIRMAIPLYVLVDPLGDIQYAGNGGWKLEDLASKIESVLVRQDTQR